MSAPLFYLRALGYFALLPVSSLLFLPWALVRRGLGAFNHDYAHFLGWAGRLVCGVRVEVEHAERLERAEPAIYVGNHQHGFDLTTYGGVYPRRTVIIGKRELVFIPFFGVIFWFSGNILLNRGNRTRAVAALGGVVAEIRRRGASVFLFPEGTRNRTDEPLLPFKRGAFYMAIQAGIPIVPIVCQRYGPVVDPRGRRFGSGTVRLRVLEAIPVTGLGDEDASRLAELTRERMLEALRELGPARASG